MDTMTRAMDVVDVMELMMASQQYGISQNNGL